MAYKLVVEAKVVDESDNIVNERGFIFNEGSTRNVALRCTQTLAEFHSVESAHEKMNKTHSMLRAISELIARNGKDILG